MADNTIVFFTSDNGPQPGLWTDVFVDFFDGNGPFKGAKTNFYEGGIRTPMLVRWPGKIKAGSESEFVGYFADVMPTLAELAGATQYLPKQIDGISFAPTLLGHADRAEDARVSVLGSRRHEAGHVQQAVRWGNWKAVRNKAADQVRAIRPGQGYWRRAQRRGRASRRDGEDQRHLPRGSHARAKVRAGRSGRDE